MIHKRGAPRSHVTMALTSFQKLAIAALLLALVVTVVTVSYLSTSSPLLSKTGPEGGVGDGAGGPGESDEETEWPGESDGETEGPGESGGEMEGPRESDGETEGPKDSDNEVAPNESGHGGASTSGGSYSAGGPAVARQARLKHHVQKQILYMLRGQEQEYFNEASEYAMQQVVSRADEVIQLLWEDTSVMRQMAATGDSIAGHVMTSVNMKSLRQENPGYLETIGKKLREHIEELDKFALASMIGSGRYGEIDDPETELMMYLKKRVRRTLESFAKLYKQPQGVLRFGLVSAVYDLSAGLSSSERISLGQGAEDIRLCDEGDDGSEGAVNLFFRKGNKQEEVVVQAENRTRWELALLPQASYGDGTQIILSSAESDVDGSYLSLPAWGRTTFKFRGFPTSGNHIDRVLFNVVVVAKDSSPPLSH
uniref:Uncharacterized protein n=1 Tax=Sicyonia whispovirus TaxID=2984283 RepID=A0A9C7EZ54_9VIRU|nr:MAG: hypothetical protein [Sicyonia whispovirus]